MTAERLNRLLRERLPGVHSGLKALVRSWMESEQPLFPMPKRVGGQFVWVHPRLLGAETAITQPVVAGWIARRLEPGSTFFDVGAHYGWMSLQAARRVGRTGSIVAFEPSPVLAQILRYHQRVNRMDQMRIVVQAVSDRDCDATPFRLLNNGLSSQNSLTFGGNLPETTVPSTTLDRFCSTTGLVPDLVKIDVEGAELMVLQGASRLLTDAHPDIIVEVHPHLLPPGQTADQIFDLLRGHGYVLRESDVAHVSNQLWSVRAAPEAGRATPTNPGGPAEGLSM